MACCNNIEPTQLGCFVCGEEIIAETADQNGEYRLTLLFRGSMISILRTFAIGDVIDLNDVFDFEFAAPYQYELLLTRPDLSEAKYCFTMKTPILC